MVARKPRIVIIGAGMAGLTAANRLVQAASNECFDLVVVEAGYRIGGRIHTSEFGGDRVELGATWIHGIGGSPVYKIAEQIGSLESEKPWERMDGFPEDPIVKVEGGVTVDSSIVQSVSHFYKTLMDVAQAKPLPDSRETQIARDAVELAPRNDNGELSIGAFVRQGL
jgi:spermine oxidase